MRIFRSAGVAAIAVLVAGCGSTAAVRSAVTTPSGPPVFAGAWRTVPSPAAGAATQQNQVGRVAAVSATDAWAVGASTYPNKGDETATTGFADHWDGRRWSPVAIAATRRASAFAGVAATSGTDAWIVGTDDRAGVIDHWDGRRWSRSYTLRGAGVGGRQDGDATLSSVVATSPRDAWAVGALPHTTVHRSGVAVTVTLGGATTVLLHWDGSRWRRIVAGALTGDPHLALASLAATGPRDVWAAGLRYRHNVNDAVDVAPLLAHWDGVTWSIVATPAAPGNAAEFGAVTATAANDAWAVGNSIVGNGLGEHPLAEHWNGRTWSIVPGPGASGSLVSAAGDGHGGVYAVLGGFTAGAATALLHWSGGRWSPVPFATPGLTGVTLADVASIPGTPALWTAGGADPAGGSDTTPAVPLFATNLVHR